MRDRVYIYGSSLTARITQYGRCFADDNGVARDSFRTLR